MKQDHVIGKIKLKDLKEALALVRRVFLEYEAPDYNDEGITEFMKFIEYTAIKQELIKGRFRMWTCVDGEKIVGVLASRSPCHISLLFVDGAHQRKGTAKALLDKLIDFYKANYDYREITVNSSPYAVNIYHKLGFIDTDVEQTVNGIRFVPMKRPL